MRVPFVALLTVALFAAPVSRANACDDPRLSDAAAALLLGSTAPSESILVDATRRAGSNAVALLMVRADSGSESLAALRDASTSRDGAFSVCGEAEAEGTVVRIVGREGAQLRATITDAGLVVDVELRTEGQRATLEARSSDGTTFRRVIDRRSLRVPLPNGFRAPFVAQVVADGPNGPLPIASLGYGSMPTTTPIEESIDGHIARLRRFAEVSELRSNGILARVAVAHAEAVCREGRATHVVDDVDPVERVRRAGLEARTIGEVVARATDVAAAIEGLDRSPSHRNALEDDGFTDVGTGTVTVDGHTCVVVILAAWPRFAGR